MRIVFWIADVAVTVWIFVNAAYITTHEVSGYDRVLMFGLILVALARHNRKLQDDQ